MDFNLIHTQVFTLFFHLIKSFNFLKLSENISDINFRNLIMQKGTFTVFFEKSKDLIMQKIDFIVKMKSKNFIIMFKSLSDLIMQKK